jgi:hypothetical protein
MLSVQIAFGMLKCGQRAIEEQHLPIPALRGDFISDALGSRRENRLL